MRVTSPTSEGSVQRLLNLPAVETQSLTGSSIMNFVPLPISLSKEIVPFIASINRFETAYPKPCPLALVVIIGVNSLGLTL